LRGKRHDEIPDKLATGKHPMNRTLVTTMMSRTTIAAAFAFALFALAPAAQATDVRIVNYVSYTYANDSAVLTAEAVKNADSVRSDALRLELWAFTAPYAPGMSGMRLAMYQLPRLDAGAELADISSGRVPFTLPPSGVWYLSMLLTEFTGGSADNDGYVVRDWLNFATPEYIGVAAPAHKLLAVEFYHAGFDHYFVAATTSDISDLDNGVHPGWARTGHQFQVWDGPVGVTQPVCRYYIPPGYGDSHFFSAMPDECAIALVKFPWLVKESDRAFYIALPNSATGRCAVNEVPVYRLWNGRGDSNHRYTTSTVAKAQMIAAGYVAEGYGPDQVGMCAPL
jgi:hypothetical protein